MSLSTHILDTALGRPAANVAVTLSSEDNGNWQTLNSARTDGDGRIRHLLPGDRQLTPGTYRIAFQTAEYFAGQQLATLYPVIEITFTVREGEAHYHIPLLLAANGYSTYRGT